MIKKIYLCGHTGSMNRGCEAIVRSTATILNKVGISDITLLSFDEQYDRFLNLQTTVKIVSYPNRSFIEKVFTIIKRKLFKDWIWGFRFFYKKLFDKIKNDAEKDNTMLFNIGGDTYCYSAPYLSYALNEMAEKNGIPTVFWGCSLDERILSDKTMKNDVNRYSYIAAREKETFENIKNVIKIKEKLLKVCDPAFHLEKKKTPLPEKFIAGNTLGINVSHLIFSNIEDENDIIYKNIRCLIDYVLSQTDMAVCLIPHVYNSEKNSQDIKVLRKIFKDYKTHDRISIIEKELSCSELKYIISKCRFFIGARTHATIAAYSSEVPAIALGYSIKSIGIAEDIFGTSDGYVLSKNNITAEDDIKNAFTEILIKNENRIREHYKKILPEYKQSIIDATKKIIGGIK